MTASTEHSGESSSARPIAHHIHANGIRLAVFEWPGADPPVLFFHATGFHARCWDQVIAHLNGRRCIAVDARGHGRTDKPPPPYPWPDFGKDAAEIATAFGVRGAIGVGHSMGGNAVTRAAAALPEAFSALLLIDPVIFARSAYHNTAYTWEDHFILQRRSRWNSADEMFASFKGRGPFKNWREAVLRDYCEYGLLPASDSSGHSGYVLACPPEIEAHIYASALLAQYADIYTAIERVQVPTRVLRCGLGTALSPTDFTLSPTAPDLAAHFARGEDVVLPDLSHFIPMEAPELVAKHIVELS